MTDRTGAVYVESNTELSWPIGLGANCDENQIEKLRDLFYKYGLRQKWNWANVINQTGFDLWRKLNNTITWSIV